MLELVITKCLLLPTVVVGRLLNLIYYWCLVISIFVFTEGHLTRDGLILGFAGFDIIN